MVSDVPMIDDIEFRLRQAASLPQLLSASFDAFEAIRMTARDCEGRAPELFAAFMTAADAAVDGREALTIAPSLPQAGGAGLGISVVGADPGQAADLLVTLASVLRDRLTSAVVLAVLPGDRAACQDAAAAARRICRMVRGEP
jgi:hypothetical protein